MIAPFRGFFFLLSRFLWLKHAETILEPSNQGEEFSKKILRMRSEINRNKPALWSSTVRSICPHFVAEVQLIP